jgi:hypothetical protein
LLSKWGIIYEVLTWKTLYNLKYSINFNPEEKNLWNLIRI